jgi:hypothetical protein
VNLPRLRLAGLLVVGMSLALPASAVAGGECTALANCTSLPNTPWIAVPAAVDGVNPDNQGGIQQPGTVLWRTSCPDGQIGAGRDYNPKSPNAVLLVNAFILPFGIGLTGAGDAANFYASWQGSQPTSFQPLVGCVPAASSSTARAAGGRHRLRTATRRLRRRAAHRFVHRCRSGERLDASLYGVAFHEAKPPTRRELRQLEVRHQRFRGRAVLRITTGKAVADDERVTVQLHALCRP